MLLDVSMGNSSLILSFCDVISTVTIQCALSLFLINSNKCFISSKLINIFEAILFLVSF